MVGGKLWEKGKVGHSGRGGLEMGPHPDRWKQVISHPSYISVDWGGEWFRDPKRRAQTCKGT